MLDSWMLPRYALLERRLAAFAALLAAVQLGCPQLLGDEFQVQLGHVTDDLDDAAPGATRDGSERRDAGSGGSGAFTDPDDVPPDPTSTPAGGGGSGAEPLDAAVVLPPDPAAAVVVSIVPANAATGVAPDAVITLTFSEPMAPDAVEAAYRSSDLPPGSVSFSWSQNDTVLVITPAQALELGTGANVNTAVPRRYALQLGSGALAADGDSLAPFSASFTTLRQISQTLAAVQDRTLTGNWRSDDVFGTNDCAVTNSVACIGDSSNGNSTYRGFLTFELGSLPTGALQVSAAQLRLSVDTIVGSPFPTLGTLGVEHVRYESIGLSAFNAAPFGGFIDISTSAGQGDPLSADVSSALAQDLAERERSQFRFRFTTASDQDGTADMVEVLCGTAQLAVTYRLP
jgi:hypothetical protein